MSTTTTATILNSLLLSANTLINQPESWERSTALLDIWDAAIEINNTDPSYKELVSKIINICSKPFSAASAS